MIIVDTNVLSELTRPRRAPQVVAWLDEQPISSLYTTTITMAEMLYGIARLPGGRRRTALATEVRRLLFEELAGRILPFDQAAAQAYADVTIARVRAGLSISQLDCQIAGIARSRGAQVATRNVSDFSHCDLEVIDPWYR